MVTWIWLLIMCIKHKSISVLKSRETEFSRYYTKWRMFKSRWCCLQVSIPLNYPGLFQSNVFHSAAVLILAVGSELSVGQQVERPVLAERQVWLLRFNLLPILQQIDFNLGWMEPIHIAVQVIWLSIFWWVSWVHLNLWRTLDGVQSRQRQQPEKDQGHEASHPCSSCGLGFSWI